MKILVSAYACEPGKGSEPGVGWSWSLAAAKKHQVWVITRANNLPNIEAWEERNGKTGICWVGFDGPTWRCKLKKKFPKGDQWYYSWWQKAIVPEVKKLNSQVNFDLIHHVTFVTHQYPSYLHRIGPPLIFGPLAGADRIPSHLRVGLSLKDRFTEIVRDMAIKYSTFRPAIRETIKQAAQVIAANSANAEFIRTHYDRDPLVRPAMTVEAALPKSSKSLSEHRGLRLLAAGRLIGLKGHWLSLRVLAQLPPDTTLNIVGNGSDEKRLQKQARLLGLADRVRWHPWMPQSELYELMSNSDGFLAPSLRDSGGMTVLEAIRCGCPVVAIALGGPKLVIKNAINGFLVQPDRSGEVTKELVSCCLRLEKLAKDKMPTSIEPFGVNALTLWLDELYRRTSKCCK